MVTTQPVLPPLDAYRALEAFARRCGRDALALAMHAAVAESIRADMLPLLRRNFLPPDCSNRSELDVDVLFADFTEHLGDVYFRFDPEVRQQLVEYLDDSYEMEGTMRSERVAEFVLAFVAHLERTTRARQDRLLAGWLETQRWVALAFRAPSEAAEQLAKLLESATLPGGAGVRLRVGSVASVLYLPLAKYRHLLDYAAGIEAIESGNAAGGKYLLESLGNEPIQVGSVNLAPASKWLSTQALNQTDSTESTDLDVGESATARPSSETDGHVRSRIADLDALRSATARLEGEGVSGTGYLIAEKLIATCEHVVRKWPDGTGTVFLGRREITGRVMKADAVADCAIVELAEAVEVKPLPLATAAPARKAVWEGFGFAAIAGGAGIAIDGHVQDANANDNGDVPSLLLFSSMLAAGQPSSLRGLSGTPVAVDGAVVGHFKKHLGDSEDRARAAYGLLYATPASAIRALLGDVPLVSREMAAVVDRWSEHIAQLSEGEFHVYISYRSTDRAFVRNLIYRLEGAGLRVYVAENEIRPGDSIVSELNRALDRSKACITVVSRHWLASPWCQAEADSLVQRKMRDPKFRIIPLRIDDSAIPVLLTNYRSLDVDPRVFDDAPRAAKLLDELLWGLVDRAKPEKESAERRMTRGESEVAGNFTLELKLAANRGAAAVMLIWRDWRESGLQDVSPALKAAEILVGQARSDLAVKILDELKPVEQTLFRAKQLRGLALAKWPGRRDEAIELFERLRAEGHRDPETTGNLAAAYRARFRQSGDEEGLKLAFELYLECFEQTRDAWNGVGAAALALRLGLSEKSRDVADEVARILESKPADGRAHWDWATLAEAYLLARRKDKAAEYYRTANAKAGGRVRDVAVMREGARDNLSALGEDRYALDAHFTVPTVVAFVGHMTDPDGRTSPRFPRQKMGAVRAEIRRRLELLKPAHSFSGIAQGSDIIFLEELLGAGGTPFVILPIPEADFQRTSVTGPWSERFDELIKKVELEVLNDVCPPADELPDLFHRANREVQQRAITYAESLFGKPKVIAVWDGKPGNGKGGTADAVERWQFDGYDVDIIDPTAL